ncbi:MAG: ABC transporter permease subunit [Fervidicoccaceae archaeon]
MRLPLFSIACYAALLLASSLSLTALLAPLLVGPSDILRELSSARSLRALVLSASTATASLAASLLIALPTAYALSKKNFPGRGVLLELSKLPAVMPPIALGLSLLLFLKRTSVGAALDSLVGLTFEVPGIVLAQMAVVLPVMVSYLKDVFDAVDDRHILMARSLGLSEFEALVKVAIPMRWRGILGASSLAWVRAAGEFGATLMVAGATPHKTETLPISLYLAIARGDLAHAAASALVLAALGALALATLRIAGRSVE